MNSRVVIAIAALACGALVPAIAHDLPRDGKIVADCAGFTITFYAAGFEPGEAVPIRWHVTLTTGAGTVPYTGADTLAYGDAADPLWSTSPGRPSKQIRVLWARELCGNVSITSGGGEPDGMYLDGVRVGAFVFNWAERYPSYADDTGVVAAVTAHSLVCECEPDRVEICRTPGFWGTHAGTEAERSQNITQAVLDKVGGVQVCGRLINTTATLRQDSAVESLCVSPEGEQKLQLARHLTAAALNCVMSGGGPSCAGLSIERLFTVCDGVCQGSTAMPVSACIKAIDCFNNGGQPLAGGGCAMGTCNGDGATACQGDEGCGHLSTASVQAKCMPFPSTCTNRPLANGELGLAFEPPGPAGSPNACRAATKNSCTIFRCP